MRPDALDATGRNLQKTAVLNSANASATKRKEQVEETRTCDPRLPSPLGPSDYDALNYADDLVTGDDDGAAEGEIIYSDFETIGHTSVPDDDDSFDPFCGGDTTQQPFHSDFETTGHTLIPNDNDSIDPFYGTDATQQPFHNDFETTGHTLMPNDDDSINPFCGTDATQQPFHGFNGAAMQLHWGNERQQAVPMAQYPLYYQ